MSTERIVEVGLDESGGLYVKPEAAKFPFIYREAMGVHWDKDRERLYSPKPKEWSYIEWFKQICRAAEEQSVSLVLAPSTIFLNLPEEVASEIRSSLSA